MPADHLKYRSAGAAALKNIFDDGFIFEFDILVQI